MRLLFLLSCAVLVGCRPYADFALPGAQEKSKFDLSWKLYPEIVIPKGEAIDVLNPSVASWRGSLLNLYSRFDGKSWETYAAQSKDGMQWEGHRRVLRPDLPWESTYIAANGSLLSLGEELLYVYQAGPKGATVLGIARSRDGMHWVKEGAPILELGPRMSWDEVSLGDPYLWKAGEYLYLCYLGEDRARRQRLGVARSRDGKHWEKQRSSPILELGEYGDFDENGLGEPAIFEANGQWVMLYTGRNRQEQRQMGYAVSADGRSWRKLKSPILSGTQDWNRQVVCDATVLAEKGRIRIWYGGGDQARPDERLNGQIGYAELSAQ